MSSFTNDYVIKNKYSRPGTKRTKTLGIVLHYTANAGGTAKNHADFFDGADGGAYRYAGAHIFVDKTHALCIIPLAEMAYQANEATCQIKKLKANIGDYYGNANITTVGVEMCIEKDGTINEKTFNRTVDVVVELCKKYNLDDGDLYRHYDVTGKLCPLPWVVKPSEWTRFKNAVQVKLKKKSSTATTTKKTTNSKKETVIGTIKVLVDNLNYYNGPRWTKPTGTAKKNTVLTIVAKIKVGDAMQYKTVVGNYITANSKYVKFTKKD